MFNGAATSVAGKSGAVTPCELPPSVLNTTLNSTATSAVTSGVGAHLLFSGAKTTIFIAPHFNRGSRAGVSITGEGGNARACQHQRWRIPAAS
ncbi:MAG: hypothetical protein U1F43_03795 [Myxococcota bacterium]